jgi:hypothetical protein
MTEKELRKEIRKHAKGVLKEENIITKLLGKIFDGMSVAAQKRALKKMMKTPEIVSLMKSADNPITNDYINKIKNL